MNIEETKELIMNKIYDSEPLTNEEAAIVGRSLNGDSKQPILEEMISSVVNGGTCPEGHTNCAHAILNITNSEVDRIMKKAFDAIMKTDTHEDALRYFIIGLSPKEMAFALDIALYNFSKEHAEKQKRKSNGLDELLGLLKESLKEKSDVNVTVKKNSLKGDDVSKEVKDMLDEMFKDESNDPES